MKQKLFRYVFFLIVGLLILLPNKVSASTYDYTIEKYDINMVVNENNTFDITETITTNFNIPKHGIIRKIPLKNTVVRNDGTTSKNRAKITNLRVSDSYITSKDIGYEEIKIGSQYAEITGNHEYKISYTYDIGNDKLKNNDELYLNLIGNEWDTSIDNISFTIKMPKEFDKNLLGFSTGEKGSTNSSNVKYNVTGNTITGNVTNKLYRNEGVTVRLTLPDGYFTKRIDALFMGTIAICAIFVLIADRIWAVYGKDKQVVETVEFYPPEGYNSAELELLYKGEVSESGIISLLIYLANKGYLKIEKSMENVKNITQKNDDVADKEKFEKKIQELEEQIAEEKQKDPSSPKLKVLNNLLKTYKDGRKEGAIDLKIEKEKTTDIFQKHKSKNDPIIVKVKDYDGTNENERRFFQGLFSVRNYIRMSDLYDSFYRVIDRIKADMNSKKNKELIYEKTSVNKYKCLIGMMAIIVCLITIVPTIKYYGTSILMIAIPVLGILGVFLYAALNENEGTAIAIVLLGLLMFVPVSIPSILEEQVNLIAFIIGLICIAVIFMFMKLMPKRTELGTEMLGKIKGFRRFLKTAEKSQLEKLVSENPEYFYNILPYTYALDVSDVWINQFETIALKKPEWYNVAEDFDMHEFGKTMHKASSAMTYSAPNYNVSSGGGSSSGGSSSGGGSSGGGSGGGGGSSW